MDGYGGGKGGWVGFFLIGLGLGGGGGGGGRGCSVRRIGWTV